MATIGTITVPGLTSSSLTWPLIPDIGCSSTAPYIVTSHRFAALDEKSEQKYLVGNGPTKHQFKKSKLSYTNRENLLSFYESLQGVQTFIYNLPNPGGGTTATTVVFDQQPISFDQLSTWCSTGFYFLEVDTTGASYNASASCVRFPSTAMATALTAQIQQWVPLVHIKPVLSGYPDIYLSDQRVTITDTSGGSTVKTAMGWSSTSQLYLPRILELGEAKTDVILTQTLSSSSKDAQTDTVSFSFANGDTVMTQVFNSVDMKYASIDLCLYHVQSSTILQLWKGFILDYTLNGTAVMTVKCNDGLYSVYQQYPKRVVSRFCQNTFDDGITCPFTLQSGQPNTVPLVSGGAQVSSFTSYAGTTTVGDADSTACDYIYDSPYIPGTNHGGCLQHGRQMFTYFTGIPMIPQSVNIHDEHQGDLVTSTSIQSNTAMSQVIPEIYCNQGDTGLNAFVATPIMLAIRNESTYNNGLGLIGIGPLGANPTNDPSVSNAFTIIDRQVQSGGNTETGPWVTSSNSKGNGYAGESVEFLENVNGNWIQIAPTLDGELAPNAKYASNSDGSVDLKNASNGGLRQVWGWSPIPDTDLGWNQCDLTQSPGSAASGGTSSTYTNGPMQFSAGVALVELLDNVIGNQSITPTPAESHSMTVPIAQGLAGWEWDYTGGTRSLNTLTNPFWIAVNTYLRALGLDQASSATQLEQFVLSSLIQSTALGGTAQIADDSVPVIVGTGDETQFQFQGSLNTQKSYRDWLQEILNTALGYYTWEFGKLKLGCRYNATPTDAYTLGNTLYQSVSMQPIACNYEKAVMNFMNQAIQDQQDQAEYWDRDHSNFYGRVNCPLTTRFNSAGVCTMSQALRILLTLVWEQQGGITQDEWAAARMATWSTTLMGLSTEVGQVISLTHPMCPGGVGNFRVTSLKLMKDWSISFTGQTVTDSMYDYDYGAKVVAVVPQPLQVLTVPLGLQEWQPYFIQANSGDALYPSEWTFDVNDVYYTDASNAAQAFLACTGIQPVNNYIPGCGPPLIYSAKMTQSSTGGSIPDALYKITICGTNAAGQCSPPSGVVLLYVNNGTGTSQFTLENILWPSFAGLTGYTVFCSTYNDLLCAQVSGSLTAGTPDTTYTPTTVTLTSIERSTWSPPNTNLSKIELVGKIGIHFGIIGAPVDAVAMNTITANECVNNADLTGRVLSIIGRQNGSVPFQNYNITAFDATTGTFTLDRDPSSEVLVNDVFVVSMMGYDNSADPTVFTDGGIANQTNINQGAASPGGLIVGSGPGTGFDGSNGENGHMFLVIAGTSRGQSANIISNTGTSVTLDAGIVLDSTSVPVIVAPTWTDNSRASAVNCSVNNNPTTLTMTTTNYIYQSLLVGGLTYDSNNVPAGEQDMPFRMAYVYGNGGLNERTVTANTTVELGDGIILCDTTSGNITVQMLSSTTVPGRKFIITKISSDTNTVTIVAASGETVNGAATNVLTDQWDSAEILMAGG